MGSSSSMVVICGYIREPPGILTNSNGIWVCCVTSVVSNSVALKRVSGSVNCIIQFLDYRRKAINGISSAEKPEIKLPTSAGSSKKQESSRKTSISALMILPKTLTMWITINCGKFWKRWEYKTIWPVSWDTCMQVRKQQLELDMEQQTGSK